MEKAKSNDETTLRNGLTIVKRHLDGHVPFSVEKIDYSNEIDKAIAVLKIGGRRFDAFNVNNQILINMFPVKNFEDGNVYGFMGFPTDAAGAIFKYYKEKEKTPFEDLRIPGEAGIVGLNELRQLVREELRNVISEQGFNYSAEEVAASDREEMAQEEGIREAMISSALSFMQDVQGSANKLVEQKNLMSTNPEVDKHLGEAIAHMNQAIEIYFNNIDPSIKDDVVRRLGEVKTN